MDVKSWCVLEPASSLLGRNEREWVPPDDDDDDDDGDDDDGDDDCDDEYNALRSKAPLFGLYQSLCN